MNNEAADLELILCELAALAEKGVADPTFKEQKDHLQHLLGQAESKLKELKAIVDVLTAIVQKAKVPIFQVYSWRKN